MRLAIRMIASFGAGSSVGVSLMLALGVQPPPVTVWTYITLVLNLIVFAYVAWLSK